MRSRVSYLSGMGRLTLVICLLLATIQSLRAQDTGQICVQSFDDRDGDGLRDADEGAIAHGVGASLQNPAGLTIASRLLEDSPFAAEGLLCFDRLLAGDYRVVLSSAEFAMTTAASFTTTVAPGSAPPLFELGLAPLFAEPSSRDRAEIALDAPTMTALLQALIGGLFVVALIGIGGPLMYFFVSRRRKRVVAPSYPGPASAEAPQEPQPVAGSPPLFNDDDETAASSAK